MSMKQIILLLTIFLMPAGLAFAQYGYDNGPYNNGPYHHRHENRLTVQGCLYGGDGYYVLNDRYGNTFQLTGNTSGFNHFVGRRVTLTGRTWFNQEHPYAMSGNANADETPRLHVYRVDNISEHYCGGYGR
jgi:hypothetical protein